MAKSKDKVDTKLVEEYFPRLMKVLEEASSVGFLLKVKKGMFYVDDGDLGYTISAHYTAAGSKEIDALMESVQSIRNAVLEEERRMRVRAEALTKLTEEEKELLGVRW